MMRVALVIHSLERGGAERVMSIMANYWVTRSWEVSLVTIAGRDLDAYTLAAGIKRVALGLAGKSPHRLQGLWKNMRRWRALRKALKRIQPDVVVSFTTNINSLTLLALLGTHIPVIIAERMDPAWIDVGFARNLLVRIMYPHAAALVVQTERARQLMQQRFASLPIRVLPNPVPEHDPDESHEQVPLRELLRIAPDARIIAAMGRLGPEKGFDLLIEAFGDISELHPEWHLVIFGEGKIRSQLEGQIGALAIRDRVHLPGLVYAARNYLSQADMFVLSSRCEGFPNVLLEAMASGLPAVSFDCQSGPSDIIRHGQDGLLVEAGDVTALKKNMETLMLSSELRQRLGQNARAVQERFSLTRVMDMWNKLIDESGSLR